MYVHFISYLPLYTKEIYIYICDIYPPLWNELIVKPGAPDSKPWVLDPALGKSVPAPGFYSKAHSFTLLFTMSCQSAIPFSIPGGGRVSYKARPGRC